MTHLRRKELNGFSNPMLKAMCAERSLAVGGRNEELVNRILVHEGHARPEGDLRFMAPAEVAALSDETIFTALERFGDNQLSAVPRKRKQDKAFVKTACEKNPKALKHCTKLGNDREFLFDLLQTVPLAYQYSSLAKRADRELASAAIAKDPMLFLSAPAALKDDPSFVMPLLATKAANEAGHLNHADLFMYAGANLRSPEACLLAARNCSEHKALSVMLHMPDHARADPVIMAHLVKKSPSAMTGAGPKLRDSLPFARKVASLNGQVLPYLRPPFQECQDVVMHALVQCPQIALQTTHLADPYLERVRRVERNYLTAKDNVFQFLLCTSRHALRQPRVKLTIVSYLMEITTHPCKNAMTLALRAKMTRIIRQLEQAAEIQRAAL